MTPSPATPEGDGDEALAAFSEWARYNGAAAIIMALVGAILALWAKCANRAHLRGAPPSEVPGEAIPRAEAAGEENVRVVFWFDN